MAVPVWQSTTTATSAAGTVSLSRPALTAVGDLLVAHFATSAAVTATGWTSSFASSASPLGTIHSMLYRVADGSEGSPIVFTIAGGGSGSGAMGRVTGANTTTPLDIASAVSTWTSAGATTVTAPSITTVTDECLVVGMYAYSGAAAGTWSVAGASEQYDFNGIVMGGTATKSPAGSVGTRVGTRSVAGHLNGAQGALRPAPPPPPVTAVPRVGMIGF